MSADGLHDRQLPAPGVWSPWRTVLGFGVVSLSADLVYEGARSITGPLLASLGASALLVGVVTGAGEAIALVLRLFFGSLADRTGNYWGLTLIGYALTAVCVPLLAITPFIGAAGLTVACVLILAERTGKAVRSPSKSALLAQAAGQVGLGRGFGVHKALDQIGAFSGPLIVAGVVAVSAAIWPAMAVLAIPGALSITLLLWIKRKMPDPPVADNTVVEQGPIARNFGMDLPRPFFIFATAAGAATAGLVTYGLIGFHLAEERIVPVAGVPVLYALAMAVAAVAALASGWFFDLWGGKVLFALPVLVSLVPPLALSSRLPLVVAGVCVWGAAVGVQDSTVKALVADLVPAPKRATAYGVFAAIQGGAAIAGGALAGYLYSRSIISLTIIIAVVQAAALVLLIVNTRAVRSGSSKVR
ncbi:MAG: MFS transporter [Kineosporiaceae bacterium]|nr:MFS transporter [Aeromicrobium sp.]